MSEQPVAAHGVLPLGTVFHGRYEIVRLINQGGMGAVYECVHLKTRKHRALKVMLPQVVAQASLRDRFELEARVTADIESDHIAETFDAGIDEASGSPFLVMELLRGEDLERFIARRGPLTAEETVVLLSQAALALDRTHAAGIVHRDLKPQNLFLTSRDDGSPRLKVLDFGIAKVVRESGTSSKNTATIGTPVYMSPEQILGAGNIGAAADVYALAHIAYTLLTGEAYWDPELQTADSVFVLWSSVMAGVKEPPSARAAARRGVTLPPAFDAWFVRGVAKEPHDRPESAAQLVADLATALDVAVAAPSSAVASSLVPALPPPGPRLSSPSPTPVPSGGPPSRTKLVAPGEMPKMGRTTSAVSGDLARAPEAPPRRSGAVIPLLLASVVATGALVYFYGPRRSDPAPPSPVTAATAANEAVHVASAVPAETVAAPAQTAVNPPAAPPSPPPAASSAPAPVAVAPLTRGRLVPPPATVAPTPPPPPVAPPVVPVKNCNPPTYIDSAGHKQFKPECL